MLLGGLRYLIPVIQAAHEQGYYVITCDYLPDNIAHRYSDEYCNVSIIDKEAVLAVAKEKEIDGIMSFAVDPGVVTAAYVQAELGLPQAGPYESVCILQNKDRFRKFLTEHGFNVPKAEGFSNFDEAEVGIKKFKFPIIVKPTDSAGSKGVSRVDDISTFKEAFNNAKGHSISGRVIVEEFIEKRGCSSDSDCFSVDGRFEFVSFSAQRFDESAPNPYTPSAFSWPSTFTDEEETYLASELQRLITLLDMGTSIYNIETRIGTDGKPYIMEVSPRGGGNRLSEMVRYATGVDLIKASVRAAVGDQVSGVSQKGYGGHWAEIILHSEEDGIFEGLEVSEELRNDIIEEDLWIKPGDRISGFSGANNAVGTVVLNFKNADKFAFNMNPNCIKIKMK